MSEQDWPNLAAMFFEQSKRLGKKSFLWEKRSGAYQSLSWSDVTEQITLLARGLLAQGITKGDRVVLVSENSPAWLIADLATLSIGAITVPAYTTNTPKDHLHILNNSGARGAIISNQKLLKQFFPAAIQSLDLDFVITLDNPEISQELNFQLLSFNEVIEKGRQRHDNIVENTEKIEPEDTACIIYTSGTGGLPKGVMLSHRNLLSNCDGARDCLIELGLDNEVFLSFLPLSHSYEHMVGHFFPMTIGAEIYYAEGLETLSANMLEARPTIMSAVPRLYETMHQRITMSVRKEGGLKEKLFNATLELGIRKHLNPKSFGKIDSIKNALLEKLVRDKVRARFGGRLKALVSGGAPLNPDIGIFFTALGLKILQGYGQTETSPVISVNRPNNTKLNTVGPPMKNVEVKIANDGEILVRGDLVMQGYWNNEKATLETIKNGWVYTGDIGFFDEDGHILITDRKKDIIVNSGGDNISPQRVETILTIEPEIAQAMVYGDKHSHLVAVLAPDRNWLKELKSSNVPPHKALLPILYKVNQSLSSIEKIRHYLIADEPFTTENGLLTPTMKIRRHKIISKYGKALNALYR
jgi:long-chain acyl-CoA synthetase